MPIHQKGLISSGLGAAVVGLPGVTPIGLHHYSAFCWATPVHRRKMVKMMRLAWDCEAGFKSEWDDRADGFQSPVRWCRSGVKPVF